mmetsp:Transcript_7583/g.14617  ORF Transcript_7583/g.14617 Transcript_7583/m.14617 type:complete len:998 (-) Transcript_7583:296-3289(-)
MSESYLKIAILFLCVAMRVASFCEVGIGGMFQMRRSPAGLQREAAARSAFCDFWPNCQPGYNIGEDSSGLILWANDSSLGINVTYRLVSESSATSNTDENQSIAQLIELLLSHFIVALVGPNSSSASRAVNPISEIYSTPFVSYAATSPELTDMARFPHFFRVCPSDTSQGEAIIAFVKRAGWGSISIINTRDTYGSTGAAAVITAAASNSIKVVAQQEFNAGSGIEDDEATQRALQRVINSRTRIVVLFMVEQDAAALLRNAEAVGMTGSGWVWISSDGFTSTDFNTFGLGKISKGFIGFQQATAFDNVQYRTWNHSWSTTRNKPGGILTNFRNLSDSYKDLPEGARPMEYSSYGADINSYAPFAYDAMKLIITAVRSLARNGTTPCTTSSLKDYRELLSGAILEGINGTTGRVTFDENQDRIGASYEILNHDGDRWNRILFWDPSSQTENNLRFAEPYTAQSAPSWSSGNPGFANAPMSFVPDGSDKGEEDNSAYFYAVLGTVPVLACVFYYFIKRKGTDWAEVIGKMLTETTKMAFDVCVNVVDFASDTASFLVILRTPELQDFVIPYTFFLLLTGLTTICHGVLTFMALRSILCRKDGKFAMVEEIDEKKQKNIMLKDGCILELRNKKELEFLLNKSYHGVRLSVAGLATIAFEDFPFMVMNALILVREERVDIAILLSLMVNCFVCGLAPAAYRELTTNIDTSKKLLILISQSRVLRLETGSARAPSGDGIDRGAFSPKQRTLSGDMALKDIFNQSWRKSRKDHSHSPGSWIRRAMVRSKEMKRQQQDTKKEEDLKSNKNQNKAIVIQTEGLGSKKSLASTPSVVTTENSPEGKNTPDKVEDLKVSTESRRFGAQNRPSGDPPLITALVGDNPSDNSGVGAAISVSSVSTNRRGSAVPPFRPLLEVGSRMDSIGDRVSNSTPPARETKDALDGLSGSIPSYGGDSKSPMCSGSPLAKSSPPRKNVKIVSSTVAVEPTSTTVNTKTSGGKLRV